MSLKKQVIDYSYEFLPPHRHETIINNIGAYKEDLSDLRDYSDFLYNILMDSIKRSSLRTEIELAVLKESNKIDINSAFFGVIIGIIIGVFLCTIINLTIR